MSIEIVILQLSNAACLIPNYSDGQVRPPAGHGEGKAMLLSDAKPSIVVKASPPKIYIPCRVYDQLLYPKCYSLSCPAPGPLGVDEYQREVGTESKQGPAEPSWVQAPQRPLLLVWPSPSSNEQTQAVNDQDNRIVGLLVPAGGTHRAI